LAGGSDAATTAFVSNYDAPAPGDVIITRNAGLYSIGIVPDRQQLSLARLDDAIVIATKWAKERNVKVWHVAEGSEPRLLD
jgi:hypothetical protein